ncbi:hypothetical protein [Bradyrhizobium yuanmingense]|uniref:hypothetical protein n=1 Tax=Bradyrhizobium yuanmingense TaxID=108015 RepID=UPI001FD4C1C6|nr:hypothetical protein [Bradyrhizobium yuanmingense]
MGDLQSRQSSNDHKFVADSALPTALIKRFVSREVKSARSNILVIRAAPACGNAGRLVSCWQDCSTRRWRHRAVRSDADMGECVHSCCADQRLVNPVSGAVALETLPVVVWVVAGGR